MAVATVRAQWVLVVILLQMLHSGEVSCSVYTSHSQAPALQHQHAVLQLSMLQFSDIL